MIGKLAFRLQAFGSAGMAEGSIAFKKGSEAHFDVSQTMISNIGRRFKAPL